MAKVLVVEDDADTGATIKDLLVLESHTVEVVADGVEANNRLQQYDYDLVVLDWELPDTTGVDILKDYRSNRGKTPVLMLTGRSDFADKETGLDTGADDYLTKPFHPREFAARVRALLRRPQVMQSETVEAAGISLDGRTKRVTLSGKDLELRPKEFALLEFLMRHPNETFSADILLKRIWSSESEATESTVYSFMSLLRKKLSEEGLPEVIRTVYGRGYRFEAGGDAAGF
ncbi:MAG: response regulator transcription factor [Candidatus Obscuribacterales bacterium]|nr:response regulator transcription factor [Candidatus Obscuribacterales bacterium]